MKKKFVNEFHLEGILYEHSLQEKVTSDRSKHPGTSYITGSIKIATDNEIKNIVEVTYRYVDATRNGYSILKNICDGTIKTYMEDSVNAGKIRVDTQIALNEFLPRDAKPGDDLIIAKRAEGGFIHTASMLNEDAKERNKFKTDILISKCRRIEANEETGQREKVIITGDIFNYKGELLPVEYVVYNPGAMDYFENLGATETNPIFTQVWGPQISTTTSRKIVTESAFGDDDVRVVTNERKEYVITGASKELPEQDSEVTITKADIKEKRSEREVHLAAETKRQWDIRNSRNAAAAAPVTTSAAPTPTSEEFYF